MQALCVNYGLTILKRKVSLLCEGLLKSIFLFLFEEEINNNLLNNKACVKPEAASSA